MKSKVSILVSILALFAGFRALACGPISYYPAEYIMPRFFSASDTVAVKVSQQTLAQDMKKVLKINGVSTDDISQVLFSYSLEQMASIMSADPSSNRFVAWIQAGARNDVANYLLLAKKCEVNRAVRSGKWYYPKKNDPVQGNLMQVRDEAASLALSGGTLASRYALQAIRAMISLGEYSQMYSFWQKVQPLVAKGPVRDMCLGYTARADFEAGRQQEAMDYYLSINDFSSVELCLKMQGKKIEDEDMLAFIAANSPDSPCVNLYLQRWFVRKSIQLDYYMDWKERMNAQALDAESVAAILPVIDAALNNPGCRQKAPWYYARALVMDMSGNPAQARAAIASAASAKGTPFIKESVKVMQIYLDAKTSEIGKDYEKKLLAGLKWLDEKIETDITPEVREETATGAWLLNSNFSYYYWNDMMRRIVLGEVCPRMFDSGMSTTALSLANMADNRLLTLVGEQIVYNGENNAKSRISLRKYRNWQGEFNSFDYCNAFFTMADTLATTTQLYDYICSVSKFGSALEKFANERSYLDSDYFSDILATKFLRQGDYRKALEVLQTIPSSYQHRLNTEEYMVCDPFTLYRQKGDKVIDDYKLNFAREMVHCQDIIENPISTPQQKGEAMVRMGCGLRSSVSFAWPLTDYSYGDYKKYYPSSKVAAMRERGGKMIDEGIAMMTDREIKAEWLVRTQRRLSVVQSFRDTRAAAEVLLHCDEYKDYR